MDDEMRKVDINRADIEELAQLSGIAENLARRIIEYRETVHPFEEVIELAAVPGISERMVREFADQVTVEPVETAERSVSMPDITLEPKDEPAPDALVDEDLFEFVTDTPDEPAESADTTEETEAATADIVEEADEAVEEAATEETDRETAVPEPVESEMEIEPELAPEDDETADLPPLPEPMKFEPQPAAEPEPVPAPRSVPQPTAPAPTQGRVLGQILLGSILGAFVGALLTLAILAALNNGTLSFTQADSQLRGEIQNAQQAQNDLQQTVDNMDAELNTNLGAVATRAGELFLQQQETDESLQAMTAEMRQTNADVAALEEITETLDERLTTVAAAAETFDAFLDGLRDLLAGLDDESDAADTEDVEATEATPTSAATAVVTPTATDAAADNGDDATATAVPSATSRPTRTPRPTATPIPLPTSTPSQQP